MPPPSGTAASAANSAIILRLHWLGKDKIAGETNAAGLMRIWQEPESARVEEQTIEKLSHAPWRLLSGDDKATNAANALLLPVLNDLVRAESYLEVTERGEGREERGEGKAETGKAESRNGTSVGTELAFAIRLDDARARVWQSNLAGVVESLSGNKVAQSANGGWEVKWDNRTGSLENGKEKAESRNLIQLTRAGEWMVFGFGGASNALAKEFVARIQRDRAPFGSRPTNFWVEANFDVSRIVGAFVQERNPSAVRSTFSFLPASVHATVIGDGTNVLSRASLEFPKPLPNLLNPWTVPTNVVQSPMFGFTAVRGIRPVLQQWPLSSAIPSNSIPDQFYWWDGIRWPFDSMFAIPVADATNVVNSLGPLLTKWIFGHLPGNYGSLSLDTNAATFEWVGLPHAMPFLEAISSSDAHFVFGGFSPYVPRRNSQMASELLSHILDGTNLLAFDWELTGQRLQHWRYLDDVYRILFDLHGPRLTDTASYYWILNNLTNLSHSVTEIRVTDKEHLSFARKSTVGLTSLEINMLANWFELSEFPKGLTTLMATNPAPLIRGKHPAPPQ